MLIIDFKLIRERLRENIVFVFESGWEMLMWFKFICF
jgi:hypothetical protein